MADEFPWLEGRSDFKPDEPCGQITHRAVRKVTGPIRYQFTTMGGAVRRHNVKPRKVNRPTKAKRRPW